MVNRILDKKHNHLNCLYSVFEGLAESVELEEKSVIEEEYIAEQVEGSGFAIQIELDYMQNIWALN